MTLQRAPAKLTEPHEVARFKLRGGNLLLWNAREKEVVAEGPSGCVAGETLFLDPETGIETPIAELVRLQRRPLVQTLYGPVLADIPFLKSYARLYRVTLASGLSFLGTHHHRVLTVSGWKQLHQLECGQSLLASSSESALSESRADARHSMRIGAGSQGHCSEDSRRGDPLPQLVAGSDLASAPSVADAPSRSHAGWQRGESGTTAVHTLLVRSLSRLSMPDSVGLLEAGVDRQYPASVGKPLHDDGLRLSVERSLTLPDLETPTPGFLPRVHSICTSFDSPQNHYRVRWDTVQSITYERTDFYYDLHVPDAEHYFAQGVWHHNTGKTRTILELINLLCHKYPGLRVLIVRKHAVTLTNTCLVTFNEKVLRKQDGVKYFGGSTAKPAAYQYPNGSSIVVGGMDDPDKVLSAEYDLIYENEGTELNEESHETLLTRLRNGVLPNMRIIADCNPTAAKNWLHQRCDRGQARVIYSRLTDNPAFFNDDGSPTQSGSEYLKTLESLSGTRRKRFLLGQRVGVENAIYPHFDRDIHVRELEPGLRFTTGAIGGDYGRRHKGAFIPVSVDQYGRRWVREAWSQVIVPDNANAEEAVGSQKLRFGIRRGRTDPTVGWMAGSLGFNVADGANGARINRTKLTGRLFNYFPGGRVPSVQLELNQERFLREFPQPPFREPDSPGLLLVKGAPGIDELCDQLEDYHEVYIATDRKEDFEVARINEDMVAALEYAIEELESPAYEYKPPEATLAYTAPVAVIARSGRPEVRHGGAI